MRGLRVTVSVGVCLSMLVVCSAMSHSELEDFSKFLRRTSVLDQKLKDGFDSEQPDDEEDSVSDDAWEKSGKFEGDLILNDRQRRTIVEDVAEGLSRNGLKDSTKRWPNNEVVYYIQKEHFSGDQVQAILDGIDDLARASCIKFRPYKKGDRDAVVIQGSRRGCFSQVGYQGGYQVLNLSGRHPVGKGCFRHGTVVHEMLHTLGFYHMQSSPDRDDYIDVLWENIVQPARHNFKKYNAFSVSDFGVGYDYDSVLHYSRRAFSANGQDTLVPKKGGAQIGQRIGLSDKDTEKLNKMYCDADSNNFDESEPSKPKKKAKNQPFQGHGIGYHQGKAVVIKLPAAKTYSLTDLTPIHIFNYFSKAPQALPPTLIEGYRTGKKVTNDYSKFLADENHKLKDDDDKIEFNFYAKENNFNLHPKQQKSTKETHPGESNKHESDDKTEPNDKHTEHDVFLPEYFKDHYSSEIPGKSIELYPYSPKSYDDFYIDKTRFNDVRSEPNIENKSKKTENKSNDTETSLDSKLNSEKHDPHNNFKVKYNPNSNSYVEPSKTEIIYKDFDDEYDKSFGTALPFRKLKDVDYSSPITNDKFIQKMDVQHQSNSSKQSFPKSNEDSSHKNNEYNDEQDSIEQWYNKYYETPAARFFKSESLNESSEETDEIKYPYETPNTSTENSYENDKEIIEDTPDFTALYKYGHEKEPNEISSGRKSYTLFGDPVPFAEDWFDAPKLSLYKEFVPSSSNEDVNNSKNISKEVLQKQTIATESKEVTSNKPNNSNADENDWMHTSEKNISSAESEEDTSEEYSDESKGNLNQFDSEKLDDEPPKLLTTMKIESFAYTKETMEEDGVEVKTVKPAKYEVVENVEEQSTEKFVVSSPKHSLSEHGKDYIHSEEAMEKRLEEAMKGYKRFHEFDITSPSLENKETGDFINFESTTGLSDYMQSTLQRNINLFY